MPDCSASTLVDIANNVISDMEESPSFPPPSPRAKALLDLARRKQVTESSPRYTPTSTVMLFRLFFFFTLSQRRRRKIRRKERARESRTKRERTSKRRDDKDEEEKDSESGDKPPDFSSGETATEEKRPTETRQSPRSNESASSNSSILVRRKTDENIRMKVLKSEEERLAREGRRMSIIMREALETPQIECIEKVVKHSVGVVTSSSPPPKSVLRQNNRLSQSDHKANAAPLYQPTNGLSLSLSSLPRQLSSSPSSSCQSSPNSSPHSSSSPLSSARSPCTSPLTSPGRHRPMHNSSMQASISAALIEGISFSFRCCIGLTQRRIYKDFNHVFQLQEEIQEIDYLLYDLVRTLLQRACLC